MTHAVGLSVIYLIIIGMAVALNRHETFEDIVGRLKKEDGGTGIADLLEMRLHNAHVMHDLADFMLSQSPDDEEIQVLHQMIAEEYPRLKRKLRIELVYTNSASPTHEIGIFSAYAQLVSLSCLMAEKLSPKYASELNSAISNAA